MSDALPQDTARKAPSRFDEVIGHERPISLVRQMLASGRLPHALVFQGPEGVGKGIVAKLLAAALLCDAPEDRPCGRCDVCVRVAHASHPDLFVVGREARKGKPGDDDSDEDDGASQGSSGETSRVIKVDQIRNLTAHAAFAPREGRSRVFVVDPADRMNVAAQNALLKTLEEPPGSSVLVLVTSRPHLLLPTVRSRCLAVRFAAMPVPALARRLQSLEFAPEDAMQRAALAGGRAGIALGLDLASVRARREEVLRVLERLSGGPRALADLAGMAGVLSGDGEEATLLEGLELVEALLRDAALAASGAPVETLVHADLEERTAGLGERLGRSRAAALVRSVERLRNDLRFNPNEKILADCLWAAVAGGPLP